MNPWKDKNIEELRNLIKTFLEITSTDNLCELRIMINEELEKRKSK